VYEVDDSVVVSKIELTNNSDKKIIEDVVDFID
jgi:hypothetical protein